MKIYGKNIMAYSAFKSTHKCLGIPNPSESFSLEMLPIGPHRQERKIPNVIIKRLHQKISENFNFSDTEHL